MSTSKLTRQTSWIRRSSQYSPYEKERLEHRIKTAMDAQCVEGVTKILTQKVDPSLVRFNQDSTVLHYGVLVNNAEIFYYLLGSSSRVNVQDKDENTPLHLAVEKICSMSSGNRYKQKCQELKCIIEDLMIHGANITAKNRHRSTPLEIAVKASNLDILPLLLSENETMPILNLGLKLAIGNNATDVVEYFITQGADVNIVYNHGDSPLHRACLDGHEKIVKILLEHKANPHIVVSHGEFKGWNSLYFAIVKKHKGIVRLLLQQDQCANMRKDINAASIAMMGNDFQMLEFLLEDVNMTFESTEVKENAFTALHIAVAEGKNDIMERLISLGADVNAKSAAGKTPLHIAVEMENLAAIEMLISNNADQDAKDSSGLTPVQLASKLGYLYIIESVSSFKNCPMQELLGIAAAERLEPMLEPFLSQTSNFDDLDKSKLLHLAIRLGCLKMAEFLVERGSDVEALDENNWTPLISCVHQEKPEIMEFLLTSGASVETHPTILHEAVSKGNMDIVKIMLSRNVAVNNLDDFGRSPLYLAAELGNVDVFKALLDSGGDIDFKLKFESKNFSLLHCATFYSHTPIAEILLHRKIEEKEWANLLCVTVIKEDLDMFKLYLDHMSEIHPAALHCAVRQNHVQMVKILLDRNLDVDSLDFDGDSLLKKAMRNRDLGVMEMLLQKGAKVDPIDDFQVGRAVSRVDVEMKILLCKYKDNFHLLENQDMDLVSLQVFCANFNVIEFLSGLYLDIEPEEVFYPLILAITKGRLDIVKILVERGTNVNHEDDDKKTPFHYAVLAENVEIIEYLLQKGANVQLQDSRLFTTILRNKTTAVEILGLLLQHGINVNELGAKRLSPLGAAVEKGSLEVVKFLLENDADVNLQFGEQDNLTALYSAVLQENAEILRVLLKFGADVNFKRSGVSALHEAVKKGNLNIFEMLLMSTDVDLEVRDDLGRTPLHYAYIHRNSAAINALLDYGVDATLLDRDGKMAKDFYWLETDEPFSHLLKIRKMCLETRDEFGEVQNLKYFQFCIEEINKLKSQTFDSTFEFSLYDFLKMSSVELVNSSWNVVNVVRFYLDSVEITFTFPLYKFTILKKMKSLWNRYSLKVCEEKPLKLVFCDVRLTKENAREIYNRISDKDVDALIIKYKRSVEDHV